MSKATPAKRIISKVKEEIPAELPETLIYISQVQVKMYPKNGRSGVVLTMKGGDLSGNVVYLKSIESQPLEWKFPSKNGKARIVEEHMK